MILRPNLIKDITLIEQIQRRASKFILNDYSSDYFDRLKQLNLLPLMYIFELNELVFTLISLNYPSPSFNITNYITFADVNTRSSSSGKMIHIRNNNNADRHFFSIESLDCGMPYPLLTYLYLLNRTRQEYIYKFLWSHFYQTLDITTLVHFIVYAHVVDFPTHPVPL